MTKVMHVIHWARTGITKIIRDVVEQQKDGYTFLVCVLEADPDDLLEFEPLGIEVRGLGRHGNFLSRMQGLKELLHAFAPDIVHSHSFSPTLMSLLAGPQFAHVRTIHSAYPYYRSSRARDVMKRKIELGMLRLKRSAVVCVASGVRDAVQHGLLPGQAVVINNGINFASISRLMTEPCERDARFGDRLLLCAVGRLEAQKGFDLLVQAVALLPAQVRAGMALMILGEGSEEARLREDIRRNNLEAHVFLMGFQTNPYKFMSMADVCVFSSRYEGLSIAAAEAMALGKPVVTTKVSGVPEMLTHGVNALLVDVSDIAALSRALQEILSDPQLRMSLGRAGQEFCLANFAIEQVAEKYNKLYEGVVCGNQRHTVANGQRDSAG